MSCIRRLARNYQFRKLAGELEKDFHGKITITSEGTRATTGWLEVSVDGKLIHSKKNGDGYVDTSGKVNKIKDAIRLALG